MSKAAGAATLPGASPRSELAKALASCRGAFVAIGLFSGVSNLLMLTGAIFMLEVYDRVLPSRSVPTLVVLVVLAGFLFAVQGILDAIRGRILVRVGSRLDEALGPRIYDAIVRIPLKAGNRGDGLQPLRDLDSVRGFLSGLGPIALFDLPWMPIYVGICFLLHPYIGLTALGGALLLALLTVWTEFLTRDPTRLAAEHGRSRHVIVEASRRNAEALAAMGMAERMAGRWTSVSRKHVDESLRASDVGGSIGAITKVLRMMLQSGVLAVGAWLVINNQATAGVIIAGSIIAARALAPIDMAIANWKAFVAARQGWERLNKLFVLVPPVVAPMALQPPSRGVAIENASVAPPGQQKVTLQDIHFGLGAGNGLGVIGPTGSGKSTLARLMVGVWAPLRGTVRLDGAALDQWASDMLGRHIGYLPQDVELFSGTVAQNIARFEPDYNPDTVIAAAKSAGAHDLIVSLANGYETEVGEQGSHLSAGQAQRVALARALYRDPFLVVLDEPNSNLDSEGDEALTQAILGVRQRGGIVVVIAHRPSAVAGVDQLLVLYRGRMQHFGPKEEVLAKVLPRPALVSRYGKVGEAS